MKCIHCNALMSPGDAKCVACGGAPYAGPAITTVPIYAYFFAIACGLIPAVALGGLIPIALGIGGAGACIKLSSTGSLPAPMRFAACVVITVVCWALFAGMLYMMLHARRR
jgi:hypothetical protein